MKFTPQTESCSWGTVETCIADLGFIDTEARNGWLACSTLSEVLETYLEDLVGENVYSCFGRQFPLMVRKLTVTGRTPLAVCPDDTVAEQRYDTLGKMKLWYITDADPGAALYIGFESGISAAELYDRCNDGSLEEVLHRIAPHKGDAFLIPPGTVHAASGKLAVTEIAECSDLDFRIFNWGDASGAEEVSFTADTAGYGREKCGTADAAVSDTEKLSLEAAFDFLNMEAFDKSMYIPAGSRSNGPRDPAVRTVTDPDKNAGDIAARLATMKSFTVTEIRLKDAVHINTGTADAFLIYACTGGSASLQIHREEPGIDSYRIMAGEVILVPAEVTDFFIVPEDRDTVLLEATVEPHSEEDGYIDPEAEAVLPGEN